MPKKILLIENDQAFAAVLAQSLEASGFEARITGDGKEGLAAARDWVPDGIALCVELPSMSGYLVCQKLRKDEELKTIPLVLTSAEATEETFEKHRALKARADEYLLKPFEPASLIDVLGALVGFPDPADVPESTPHEEGDEELVSLETEIGLDAVEEEPEGDLSGFSLDNLEDEPPAAEPAGAGQDEDLRLLDDAFDGIAEGPESAESSLDDVGGEERMAGEDVDAAVASLPEEDEGAERPDLGALDEEADEALGAFSDETGSPPAHIEEPARSPRGSTEDLLRAAGIRLLEDDLAPPFMGAPSPGPELRPVHEDRGDDPGASAAELGEARDALERARQDLASRDSELRELRREVAALERNAEDAETELAQTKARVESAQDRVRKAESDAKASREEARRASEEVRRASEEARAAEAEAADLRRRVAELERRAGEFEKRAADAERRLKTAEDDARRSADEAATEAMGRAEAIERADALEREADELRTELLVARGEAEGARGEVERRTAELKNRIAELEATNAKNEERVVKAYQKIKGDEKVRDKVRKALSIASQLIEDAPPESAAEKERRAAARD